MAWRNGFRVFYMRQRGVDWNDSEQSQKTGFCGHGDESLDSVEMGNILKTWATCKCYKQTCIYIVRKQQKKENDDFSVKQTIIVRLEFNSTNCVLKINLIINAWSRTVVSQ